MEAVTRRFWRTLQGAADPGRLPLYCAAISVMLKAVRPIELSEILLAERIEHGETSPLIEQVFSVAAAWANGAHRR